MGRGCWLRPRVFNQNGEKVYSKLFDDILNLCDGNHKTAAAYYKIATSDEFLGAVKNEAEYDENGQITARSFFRLSNLESEIDDVIGKINRQYAKDGASNDEVLDVAERFNQDESYKEDYTLSLKENGDEWDVSITGKTDESVTSLAESLEKIKLCSLIKSRLKEIGVAYDFVGSTKFSGRFSTRNAKEMNDGLRHLIEISTNAKNPDAALVEEAAHLAVYSMRDIDLVNRLLNILDKDTIAELFSQDEIDEARLNEKNYKLELAGKLVAKAMLGKRLYRFGGFLDRVKNAIFNMFSNGPLSFVINDKRRARIYADNIASGFLFDKNSIDINNIDKMPDVTLFSLGESDGGELLKTTLRELKRLRGNVKNVSSQIWDTRLKDLDTGNISINDVDEYSDEDIIGITITALSNMSDALSALMDSIADKNFYNDDDTFAEDGRNLAIARMVFTSFESIRKAAHGIIEEARKNNELNPIIERLNDKLNEFDKSDYSGQIAVTLLDKERAFTANFLSMMLGRKVYERSQRIAMKGLKVFIAPEERYSTYKIAESYILDHDISSAGSLLSLLFRSHQNSVDLANQAFYNAIRISKINESRKYKKDLTALRVLEDRAKKLKIDVRKFYEYYLDEDRNLHKSGYFLSEYNMRQLSYDESVVTKKVTDKFLQHLKDNDNFDFFKTLPKENKLLWFEEFKENDSDWIEFYNNAYHTERRVDENGNVKEVKVINDKYKNRTYETLSEEELKLLIDIKNLKRKIDASCLTEADYNSEESILNENGEPIKNGRKHYILDLLPQFKGKTTRKFFAKKLSEKELFDDDVAEQVCLDVTSKEFGSPLTSIENTAFNDPISIADDTVRRIPLYGINKLENMDELSENLFMSLSLYASMAHRYKSTQEVIPILSIADNALSRREFNSGIDQNRLQKESNKERNRLIDKYVLPEKKEKNAAVNIAKFFGSAVAVAILAVGTLPALKNWIAGDLVTLMDSISGEHYKDTDGKWKERFTTSDVIKANAKNLNPLHLGGRFLTAATSVRFDSDKYQKLFERWDELRNPNTSERVGYSAGRKALGHIVGFLMSNYGITDESIIAKAYDAQLNRINLYYVPSRKNEESNKTVFIGSPKEVKLNTIKEERCAYNFTEDNTPELKENLVKDASFIELYKYLLLAREDLEMVIEENKAISRDEKIDIENRKPISDLIDYLDSNNVLNIQLKNEQGYLLPSQKLLTVIDDAIRKISFSQDDEIRILNSVNDYVMSSQGLYGILNTAALQSEAMTAPLTRIKGWWFGFLQRDFLSNDSATLGDYKSAVFISTIMALLSIVNRKNMLSTMNYQGSPFADGGTWAGYVTRVLCATLLPVALNFQLRRTSDSTGNKLRTYLLRCGWSVPQLDALAKFPVGVLQCILLSLLTESLGLGNRKEYARNKKAAPDKKKDIKFEKPGVIVNNTIGQPILNAKRFEVAYSNWIQKDENGNPIFPYRSGQRKEDKIIVAPSMSYLYHINPQDYDGKGHMLSNNSIAKIGNDYYKYNMNKAGPQEYVDFLKKKNIKEKAGRWELYDYGFYEKYSQGYNDYVEGLKLENSFYENEFAYRALGYIHRLSAGVLQEAESRALPGQFLAEGMQLSKPLFMSGLVGPVIDLAKAVDEDKVNDYFKEKTVNFVLGKLPIPLEYNGKGLLINDNPRFPISIQDQYEKQDRIDQYREMKFK